MALELPFLSFAPKIWKKDHELHARTSIPWMLVTGAVWVKHVVVCPARREVRLTRRLLWLIAWTRRIPFHEIRDIRYTYRNAAPFSSFTAQDAIDVYTVELELHDLSLVTLFCFMGEGEFSNETYWPDWFYWEEYMLDMQGQQKNESLTFYELLRKLVTY